MIAYYIFCYYICIYIDPFHLFGDESMIISNNPVACVIICLDDIKEINYDILLKIPKDLPLESSDNLS